MTPPEEWRFGRLLGFWLAGSLIILLIAGMTIRAETAVRWVDVLALLLMGGLGLGLSVITWKWLAAQRRRYVTFLILLAAGSFAFFVWPSPYRYFQEPWGTMRENRFTGRTFELDPAYGWQKTR